MHNYTFATLYPTRSTAGLQIPGAGGVCCICIYARAVCIYIFLIFDICRIRDLALQKTTGSKILGLPHPAQIMSTADRPSAGSAYSKRNGC